MHYRPEIIKDEKRNKGRVIERGGPGMYGLERVR